MDIDDGNKEEVVFSVQGSIVEKDLPPLKERPRCVSKQSVLD